MIRTIIVDDEMWVCSLICSLVDWNGFGYEIIGQAHDGNTAIDMIEKLKPDLVFTDIRMPGCSGLDLIDRASKVSADSKFVIISGHSEFDYAQRAIQSGALGYILKPVEPEELSDLLVQLKSTTFALQRKIHDDEELRKQLLEKRMKLKEQFFSSMLKAPPVVVPTVGQINSECDSSFKDGLFQVLDFTVDSRQSVTYDYLDTALKNIAARCYKELSPLCCDMVAVCINSSVMCVLNFEAKNAGDIARTAHDIFYFFKQNKPHMSYCDITLGMGATADNFIASALSSQRSASSRIRLGTDRIIDLSSRTYENVSVDDLFNADQRKAVFDFIKGNAEADARSLAADIFKKAMETPHIEPIMIFSVAAVALQLIYSIPLADNIDILDIISYDSAKLMVEAFFSCDQIIDFFASLLNEMRAHCSLGNRSLSAAEVIRSYIDENYRRDITLEELSGLVFLNTKYISELFKKELGVTVTDYIAGRRFEEARNLLLSSNLLVTDIAQQVGYNDPKYFTRLFRRYNGISPAQYRKLYRKKKI